MLLLCYIILPIMIATLISILRVTDIGALHGEPKGDSQYPIGDLRRLYSIHFIKWLRWKAEDQVLSLQWKMENSNTLQRVPARKGLLPSQETDLINSKLCKQCTILRSSKHSSESSKPPIVENILNTVSPRKYATSHAIHPNLDLIFRNLVSIKDSIDQPSLICASIV